MRKKSTTRGNCAYFRAPLSKKQFQDSADKGRIPARADRGGIEAVLEGRRDICMAQSLCPAKTIRVDGRRVSHGLDEDTINNIKELVRQGKVNYLEVQGIAPTGIYYSNKAVMEGAMLCEHLSKTDHDTVNHYIVGRLLGYSEDDINAFCRRNVGYSRAMRMMVAADKAGIPKASV